MQFSRLREHAQRVLHKVARRYEALQWDICQHLNDTRNYSGRGSEFSSEIGLRLRCLHVQ